MSKPTDNSPQNPLCDKTLHLGGWQVQLNCSGFAQNSLCSQLKSWVRPSAVLAESTCWHSHLCQAFLPCRHVMLPMASSETTRIHLHRRHRQVGGKGILDTTWPPDSLKWKRGCTTHLCIYLFTVQFVPFNAGICINFYFRGGGILGAVPHCDNLLLNFFV